MIKGVPYDAEIAFLESTGSQYVDTGVPIYYTSNIQLTFAATSDAASYFFGDSLSLIGGAGYYLRVSRLADGTLNVQTDAGSTVGTPPATDKNTFYNLSISDKKCYLNGVQFATISATDSSVTKTASAYIFAWNRSPQLFGSVRISGCKITARDGITLLHDYIPVRVGSVGYLYDRVTRRLFGNAGTGAFTLGPDVATPVMSLHRMALAITAKSYIQNGLVAMWDGIENAGWGVHNPNATTWKDLVGTADVEYTGTLSQSVGYWGDKGFFAAAKGDYSFRCAISQEWLSALDGPITIDGVFTVSDSGVNNSALLQIAKASENNDGILFATYNSTDIASSIRSAWGAAGRAAIGVGSSFSYSGNKMYCAIVADASQVKEIIYLGGTKMESMTQPRYAILEGTDTLSIGTYAVSAFKSRTATGEYNRFSIYTRALSSAEIAANYAIDKERFGLP